MKLEGKTIWIQMRDEHHSTREGVSGPVAGIGTTRDLGMEAVSALREHMDDQEWGLYTSPVGVKGTRGGAGTAAPVP